MAAQPRIGILGTLLVLSLLVLHGCASPPTDTTLPSQGEDSGCAAGSPCGHTLYEAEGCPDCVIASRGTVAITENQWRRSAAETNEEPVTAPVAGEKYRVRLAAEGPVQEVVFDDVVYEENVELGLDTYEDPRWQQTYAIDPSAINFTNGTLTAVAKGNTLYKCKEYDFASRTCSGDWVFLRTITPGEPYTITLTPLDPVFGEGDSEATVDWAEAQLCSGGSCITGDSGDVLAKVDTRSDAQAARVEAAAPAGGSTDGYLFVNWTNTFGSDTYPLEVVTDWEYGTISAVTANLKFAWWTGSAWSQVCTDGSVTAGAGFTVAYENNTCNITSQVDTLSELNDIKMNVTVDVTASSLGTTGAVQFDYAGLELEVGYYPSTSTPSITPGAPDENDDLNCTFTITDSDTLSGLANVSWFKDDVYDSYSLVGWENNTQNGSVLASASTSAGEDWTCEVTPNDGTENGTGKKASNVTIAAAASNNAPTVTNVYVDGNETTNYTREDLNCTATLTDTDGDAMNVTVRWFKDDTLFLTTDYNTSFASGVEFNATLSAANTTSPSAWNCSVQAFDGTDRSNWGNSSALSIAQYPTALTVFDQEADNETEAQSSDTTVYVNEWTTLYANYTSEVGIDLSETLYTSSDLSSYGPTIKALDADGDGKRQELVYAALDNVYAYYPNGTLIWQSTNGTLDHGMETVVGDFLGNGDDEVAILMEEGWLVIYNGTDGSVLYVSDDLASGYRGATALGGGDLDSDGKHDDLVAAGSAIGGGKGIAAFIYNETSGKFENWWNATDPTDDAREVHIQDIEGGENLVAITSEYQGAIFVYYGNGTLKWNTGDLGTTDSLAFIDLDGDGVKDEIAVGEDHELRFLNSDGSENSTFTQTAPRQRIWEIVAYDADNDGTDDGVILGDWAMELYAYNYSGDLQWRTRIPPRAFETWWWDPGFHSLRLGDVNNDGRDELVAGMDQPTIYIINTSDGSILGRNWYGYEEYVLADYPVGDQWGISAGLDIVDDVNEDGVDDIGYARSEGYISWMQQIECIAELAGKEYNMFWNGTAELWELDFFVNESIFNRTDLVNSTLFWNVTCSKGAHETQVSGQRNITVTLKNTSLETFDEEDDAEDKAGWLSESAVIVNETTTFFVNYTDLTDSTSVDTVRVNDSWFEDFDTVYDVDALDSDNDGVDDAFVYGASDNIIAYSFGGTQLWNTADATYDETRTIITDDYDGNGEEDVAFSSSSGQLVILNGSDGGELFKSDDYDTAYALGAGDVNDDNLTDLLLGVSSIDGSDGFLVFFYNTTSGQYEELWNATDATGDAQDFAIAQLNGQNLVAVADGGSKNSYVYWANGTLIYSTGSLGWAHFELVFIDYSEDGVADDLLSAGAGNNYVYNLSGDLIDTHALPIRPAIDIIPFDYDSNGYANEYFMKEQHYLRMVDTDGTELWSYTDGANYDGTLQLVDINRNGTEELVMLGGNDATAYIFTKSGRLLHKEDMLHGETLTQSERALMGSQSEYGTGTGFAFSDLVENERRMAYAAHDVGGGIMQSYPRCRISFNDSIEATMNYNTSEELFYYQRNFSSVDSYNWNVTCESLDHVTRSSGVKQVNVSPYTACGTLTASINLTQNESTTGASCFTIETENITLDCKGYTIQGDSTASTGGAIVKANNVTIQNCIFKDYEWGVYVEDANRSRFDNLTLTSNDEGLRLTAASNHGWFTNLNLSNNQDYEIRSQINSGWNNFTNITVDAGLGASRAVSLVGDGYNNFTNVTGATDASRFFSVDTNYNSFDCDGRVISSTSGTFGADIITGQHNVLENCIFTGWDTGIAVIPNNNTIENVSILNTQDIGLWSRGTDGSTYRNITIDAVSDCINLDGTTNSVFENITLTGCTTDGIYSDDDTENVSFQKTDITSSGYGLRFGFNTGSSSNVSFIDLSVSSTGDGNTLAFAERVSIDCAGGTLSGDDGAGSYGLYLAGTDHDIRNCKIKDFDEGVYLAVGSTDVNITNISISSVTGNGLSVNNAGSTGHIFSNVSICSSGGTDAVDNAVGGSAFANRWLDVVCDSESGGDLCSTQCDGTLVGCGNVADDLTLAKDLVHAPPGDSIGDFWLCLNITASNVDIDCAGHSIKGPGYKQTQSLGAIGALEPYENTTIRNCYVDQFYYGVALEYNNYTVIDNVTTNHTTVAFINTGAAGITDGFVTGTNLVAENTATNALVTAGSENDTYTNLTVRNNDTVNDVAISFDNRFSTGTNIDATNAVVWLTGDTNTLRGLTGQTRVFVDSSQYDTIHCGGTLAWNRSVRGIQVQGSHTVVENCTFDGYDVGVYLTGGSGYNVTVNNVTVLNATEGLHNNIDNAHVSNVTVNASDGIVLNDATDSTYENLTINYTRRGIFSEGDAVTNNFAGLRMQGRPGAIAAVLFRASKTTENSGPPFYLELDYYHSPHDTRFTNLTINASDGTGFNFSKQFDTDYNPVNLSIDCQGGRVVGTGFAGFNRSNASLSQFTLRNCSLVGFQHGIRVTLTDYNGVIEYVNVTNATSTGFNMSDTNNGGAGSYTLTRNRFCGSGSVDAYDRDSATWTKNTCDTTGGNARCSYYCNGTATVKPSPNTFTIRDASGTVVARISDEGYMYLSGTLSEDQGVLTAPENGFIIRESTRTPVAYISETGNLVLSGTVSDFTTVTATGSDLLIRNSTHDHVALIDDSGNVQLVGEIYENY